MDERAGTSSNTVPPAAGQTRATPQDLQRAALHELVALAAGCAATETEIHRRFGAAREALDTLDHQTREDIERRHRELQADLDRRHQEFLSRIEAQYQADLNKLNASDRAARQKIDAEHANTEREVKRKLAQATWLAETVFESTVAQLRTDAKKARQTLTVRRRAVDDLQEQAAGLMQSCGLAWPLDEEPPGPSGPQTDDAPAFDAMRDRTEQELESLAAMRLPRLMSGALPVIGVLGLGALAALVAQGVAGTREPQFRAMGIAAAAAMAVAIVAGAVLRRVAVNQAWQRAARLQQALEAARRSASAEHAAAADLRQARQAEAAARRHREAEEARQRYSPILAKAARTRRAALAALDEERDLLLPRIQGQRDKSLAEVDQWRQRSQADLSQGYDRERQAARRRVEQQRAEADCRRTEDQAALARRWREGLARIQAPIDGDSSAGRHLFPPWGSPAWNDWVPPARFASTVRFGELRIDLKRITDDIPKHLALPDSFSVPAMMAFPSQASLLVHADAAGRSAAIRALQAVMIRLLTCLPAGRARFTLIDPVRLGQNFAGFMHLADHDEALVGGRIWTAPEHIEQRLADLTEHMETVIQKYLRNEFETIDDYNEQAGELAEPYRFLVIADFPVHFSDTAVQRLNSIASTGARCGVYTLVARDTRQPLPPGTDLDELAAHSINLVQRDGRFVWDDDVFRQFPLVLDEPPAEDLLTRLLHIVGRHARQARRVEVPFETIAPGPGRIGSASSRDDLAVPIGKTGATRLQMLRLGRGVAQHGLIAGKTGSGKSTLLHVIITNLALWYAPDEVEFYLVDFKKGVEFKAYATHDLPHARAIAVESDREFGLSVLQRVDAELARRGELFRAHGVQDLPAYRQTTGARLPRTLLIIDEFQEFFSEDDKLAQDAALLLDRLVRQGRAFGIHLLLGSQTIGGTSGLARSTIGQMAVRIALQTSEADSQIILGDGNSAARLLSRPGEAVYNDAGGLVEANSPFQVAWLPDEKRDPYLASLRAATRDAGIARPRPVVFEGRAPANLAANSLLAALLEAPDWPGPAGAPRVWLGEPVAIKDPTCAVLSRQSGANLLVVGQYDEPALAVLAAALISLAAQQKPDDTSFVILDGSPADSPLAGTLPKLGAFLPHKLRCVEYREAGEAVCALADEMRHRQADDAPRAGGVYLFIYGLQRYRVLRRQEDSFGFSRPEEPPRPAPDRALADLLREGPPLGLHVLAWCDTPAAVERTLDRASLREFDHRVLFQMSAADSSNLIDSPLASRLGVNRALATSEEQGTLEKFRPYAVPPADWLQHVRERLFGRK